MKLFLNYLINFGSLVWGIFCNLGESIFMLSSSSTLGELFNNNLLMAFNEINNPFSQFLIDTGVYGYGSAIVNGIISISQAVISYPLSLVTWALNSIFGFQLSAPFITIVVMVSLLGFGYLVLKVISKVARLIKDLFNPTN